jgi:hypothetical protein
MSAPNAQRVSGPANALLARNPGLADIYAALLERAPLEYCDYIAERIADAFRTPDPGGLLGGVGPVQWDLHPEGGYLLSTRKTLEIRGRNGTRYRVTVEALGP